MESTEMVTKSLLKKSVSSNLNKSKKVTFSNTVKLFIDDPNKNTKSNSDSTGMKWVEISIVDKSTDTLGPESYDDCRVTDFLVHKVIYDNYVLPDNDEDLDIQNEDNCSLSTSIVLESVSDDDGLEFVVHKVTDHEDDLIKQESDLDASIQENEMVTTSDLETNEELTKFSKLSIENILEHDKIIAFIDQKSLGLSALNKSVSIAGTGDLCDRKGIKEEYSLDSSPEKSDNSLVLSPPLQELSLDKIVKAHSDNILCELDISPLNSIQETDSDSDLSSEGTMIMMTSEECQKNEQHIRESFLQYQSRKEKMAQTENIKLSVSDSENTFVPENECKMDKTTDILPEDKLNLNGNENIMESDFANLNMNETLNTTVLLNSSNPTSETHLHKRTHSLSLPDTDAVFSQHINQNPKYFNPMRRSSFDSCAQFPVKPLTTVQIPSDVREWKILLDSLDKNSEENLSNEDQCVQFKDNINAKNHEKPETNFPPESSISVSKPDELESFVHESTERVERIRRRYYINGKQQARFGSTRHSLVRGIRPRFGSTAEILQLMQRQNHPPIITFSGTKNHMSWPCDETGNGSVLGKHNSSFIFSQSLSSECSSQSSIDSYCEDQLNSSSCDHFSISSCPSIMVCERGSPEGASPPKPLTEICDSSSEHYTVDNSDSYVYYSMKV